jgi:hypothetical protein
MVGRYWLLLTLFFCHSPMDFTFFHTHTCVFHHPYIVFSWGRTRHYCLWHRLPQKQPKTHPLLISVQSVLVYQNLMSIQDQTIKYDTIHKTMYWKNCVIKSITMIWFDLIDKSLTKSVKLLQVRLGWCNSNFLPFFNTAVGMQCLCCPCVVLAMTRTW